MEGLDVVVIGGGIGGLTAAIALGQAGHHVQVFDQVAELRPVGAGISLWSNGVKVLDRIGLGAEVDAIAGDMERMAYRATDGTMLTDFSLHPLVDRVGRRPCPVARTDLQRVLLASLAPVEVVLDARCTGVEADVTSVTAVFDDGRRITADLVVAADGTHSRLRELVTGGPTARDYAGYVNWNGLVGEDPELGPPATWTTFVGEGKRVSMMPVGGGRLYYFFDVPLAAVDADASADDCREDLRRHFAGWATPVGSLIDRLDPATTARIPIHDHQPLARFVRGRVALLGDAAHTTVPDLGQGGCQAMEDALVLAETVSETGLGVEDALERYQALRLERTADVMHRARTRARLTHGAVPAVTEAWYRELAAESGEHIMDGIAHTIVDGPCG